MGIDGGQQFGPKPRRFGIFGPSMQFGSVLDQIHGKHETTGTNFAVLSYLKAMTETNSIIFIKDLRSN